MSAFGNGRKRIRSVCAKVINQNGGKGVVLHSGLFRVDGMEPIAAPWHSPGACHRVHLCLGTGEVGRHSLLPLVNDGRRPHVTHRRSTLYDIPRR
ncbi:hypothetical protein QFZ97_002125 [Paraburkholderia youngii]